MKGCDHGTLVFTGCCSFFFSCGCLQKGDGEAEEEGCDQLVIVVADVNDVVVVVVLMTTRRGLCMD